MNKLYLTLAFIIGVNALAFSQGDTAHLTAIAGKLEKLVAMRPVEKVYLAFNKPAYDIGDTIWFKGYVVVGGNHQPSALSRVLYVDLIDTNDKLIKTLMLKNNNGVSAGDFVLDSKLPPGNYRVRAYTNWMRNFGPDCFFNQTIPVGDVSTNALFVSTAYSVTNVSNEEIVNTQLAYTDEDGKPFVNRRVSFQVRADTNLLYAGTGITDASGNVSFTFPGKTAPKQHVNVISHLKVVNDVTIAKTTPLTVPNENMDVQFFPEGGELVNGVRSRVAFKAIGTNGLGVNIKGTILDNDNNEVAEFASRHAGMGVFALTPIAGKTYSAKVMLADNLFTTVKLPVANDKGFVLAVNTDPNDSTKLNVRVTTNEATLSENKGQSFYITGQLGETIYYTTAGKLTNASFSAVVPKNRFPSGIAQFTLFSNSNEPLNERMVFIQNNSDILNLNLTATKQSYTQKEKVNLELTAKDNTNKPVQGSFSLSVYKEDKLTANENNESTILSTLLLTSDLKGYVEDPGYYFNHPSNHPDSYRGTTDLDVLLLTQGYRRFEWNRVMADDYPKITYQPEKGLSISGTLTTEKGKPVRVGKVGILSVANNIAVNAITDDQGKFTVTGFDNMVDTTTLLVQARMANNDKDVNIKLDNKTQPPLFKSNNTEASTTSVLPLLKSNIVATFPADTALLAATITIVTLGKKVSGHDRELKEVTIKARKNAGTEIAPWVVVNPRSSNLNGPGHADMVLSSKDLENCLDFLQCVMNKIPGVLRKPILPPIPPWYRYYFIRHQGQSLIHSKSGDDPLEIKYIIDGQLVDEGDADDLNVNDVETVEVLNSSSYLNVYGTSASGGLLIITTKAGTEDVSTDYNAKVAPGVIKTKFQGYYKTKEFYTPKYTAKDTYVHDTRDAVYWNPNIVTDSSGKFPAEFFNSDVKGSYRAVVEGIDDAGNIGRFVYRYSVE